MWPVLNSRGGTVQLFVDVFFRGELVDEGVAVGPHHPVQPGGQRFGLGPATLRLAIGAVQHPVADGEGEGAGGAVVIVDQIIGRGADLPEQPRVGPLQGAGGRFVRVLRPLGTAVRPQAVGVLRGVIGLALRGAQAGRVEGRDGDQRAL